mmetsp:Transcript_26507/g.44296  ORF Transcript_26507/g.44296 Transcript_26507/m.44296 type:complete len:220 (+) Transcript_26507:2833-3492(+)
MGFTFSMYNANNLENTAEAGDPVRAIAADRAWAAERRTVSSWCESSDSRWVVRGGPEPIGSSTLSHSSFASLAISSSTSKHMSHILEARMVSGCTVPRSTTGTLFNALRHAALTLNSALSKPSSSSIRESSSRADATPDRAAPALASISGESSCRTCKSTSTKGRRGRDGEADWEWRDIRAMAWSCKEGEYFMLRRSTSCIIGNMRAKEGPGKGEDSSS